MNEKTPFLNIEIWGFLFSGWNFNEKKSGLVFLPALSIGKKIPSEFKIDVNKDYLDVLGRISESKIKISYMSVAGKVNKRVRGFLKDKTI